jgi:quercetin dioxygenase-like cupin family protein
VLVVGPGEGPEITLKSAGEAFTLKATGEQTGGAIGLFEVRTLPGSGSPRHIHHSADELFYILAGEFQFLVGEQLIRAGRGTFVYIPRGTVHATKVVGAEPGQSLAGFIPGGQEHVFEELARSEDAQGGDAPPGSDRAEAIARKYNLELVGAPL